jgi:Glycosyl-4,4'-diaponeurosporenoate acyltransferase
MGGGAAFSGRDLGRAAPGMGLRSPAGGAARAHGVRKALLVAGMTIGMAALMAWSLRVFGARSAWFALAVVWLPLGWFALLGRILALRRPVLRLPAYVHALRAFERDGRVYELLGVRVAKWLLRRGPLAVGAPDLHLPAQPTPANLTVLDQRMQQAEAIHEILLAVTLTVAVGAAVRGWWDAVGWLLLFNVLANVYPAMLQRYNRALLARRFGLPLPLRQPRRRAGRRGSTQDSRRHRPFHA